MSGECEICGEHALDCNCRLFNAKGSLPNDGEVVLCIKKYMDNHGWTQSEYFLDSGFRNAFGEFMWKKGGKVSHWMRLPKIPEDL
jgi:uncharacterized protein DUF551